MEPHMITATDFKTHVGKYIDASAKAPVYITKHNRPVRVLLDIEEFERLKGKDKPAMPEARRQAIACLAIENMHVTDEDIALLERVDRMGLSPDEEVAYIMEYTLNSFKEK